MVVAVGALPYVEPRPGPSTTHPVSSQSVSELTDWDQDVASMRTLTFGDRTISYDAGLESLHPGSKSGEAGADELLSIRNSLAITDTSYRGVVVCIVRSQVSSSV